MPSERGVQTAQPLVFHQNRTPSKTAADAFEQEVLSAFDLAVFNADIQCQRNGGCGSVAVVLDGQDHFVHAQAQVFGGRVDNALVGLVRHNPIDLIGGVSGFFDNVICNFCQHFDGKFEYAGTVHADVGRPANLAVGDLSGDV